MEDRSGSMDQTTPGNAGWAWLAMHLALSFVAASNGQKLAASGLLLLGAYAFFNNPLSPTPRRLAKPSATLLVSWLCGLGGIISLVAAAAFTFLG